MDESEKPSPQESSHSKSLFDVVTSILGTYQEVGIQMRYVSVGPAAINIASVVIRRMTTEELKRWHMEGERIEAHLHKGYFDVGVTKSPSGKHLASATFAKVEGEAPTVHFQVQEDAKFNEADFQILLEQIEQNKPSSVFIDFIYAR